MVSDIYLLHRKPQRGLPVAEGAFDTAAAAIAQMRRLVDARTGTGEWSVVVYSLGGGRDVLLRRADGLVEAFFISEHHGEGELTAGRRSA